MTQVYKYHTLEKKEYYVISAAEQESLEACNVDTFFIKQKQWEASYAL